MTLTVELTPAQEAKLRSDAARAGMDPAALLLERAGYTGTQEPSFTEDPVYWQREAERFRQWADNHRPRGPVLSLEDFSRESIYGDHG